MQIKILFDSVALDNRFLRGWGVSYLIDDKVLFDTGEKSSSLFRNMRNIDVKISNIKAVVISHNHWDHRGGLWELLKQRKGLKVYACPNFGRRFKNRVKSYEGQLIETDKLTQINDDVYTTGEIGGRYAFRYMPEQALVLETPSGLTILTGCAHPGIIKIIENVKQNVLGDIYLVLGGFHLIGKHRKTVTPIVNKFKQSGVKRVAPAHCSGKNAIKVFKEEYNNNFIDVKVGQVIEV